MLLICARAAVAGVSAPEYGAPVAARQLVINTPLMENGRCACVIYTPTSALYQAVAVQLADMLEGHGLARPSIIPDNEKQTWRDESRHMLVLGNPGVSRLLRYLEFRGLICPRFNLQYYDAPLAYRIQTVHDPWGMGVNVVMLGGVTAAEASNTFAILITRLRREGVDWILPPTFEPKRPLNDAIKGKIERQIETAHTLPLNYMAYYASEGGMKYMLYGHDLFARLYRTAMLRLARARKYSHLYLFREARYWDVLENSPVFSDDDRLIISRYFYESVAHEREGIGSAHFKNPHRAGMLSNHATQRIAGVLTAADYLQRHYPSDQHRRWAEMAQAAFRRYESDFNTSDEGVLQFAVIDNVFSPISQVLPDPATHHFLRRTLDRLIPEVSNAGMILPHGDDSPYEYQRPEWFATGARVYDDPGFYWMYLLMTNRGVNFKHGRLDEGSSWWPVTITPEMPSNFMGINLTACDDALFESLRRWRRDADVAGRTLSGAAASETSAYDRFFGKAAFRGGVTRDDDYLQFDGRGELDANAIVRYQVFGRPMLFACEARIQTAVSDYNGLVVSVDGESPPMQPLAELVSRADFNNTGFLRSRVGNGVFADWTRNIVWMKNRFFVVFDQIDALKAGFFTVDSFWRTLGLKLADDHGVRVVQEGGVEFAVMPFGADGQIVDIARNPQTGFLFNPFGSKQRAIPYPASDVPQVVHILNAHTARTLAAGDCIVNGACFYATAPRRPIRIDVCELAPNIVRIEMNGSLFLAVQGRVELPGLEIDADLALLGEDGISVLNVTRLRLNGTNIVALAEPESFEWMRGAPPPAAFADPSVCAAWNATARGIIAGLTPQPTPAPRTPPPLPEMPERMVMTQQAPGASPICAGWSAPDGGGGLPALIVGRANGMVEAFDTGLARIWTFACGGRVNDIDAGDVTGDGQTEFAVGSDDCHLYVLDASGRLLLKWTPPFDEQKPHLAYGQWMWPAPYVKHIRIHDYNHDGHSEILAGCGQGTWLLGLRDGAVHVLWPPAQDTAAHSDFKAGKITLPFTATSSLFADINNDGVDELFAGADDMWHEDIVACHDIKNGRTIAGGFGAGYNGQTKSLAMMAASDGGKVLLIGTMNRGVMAGGDFSDGRQWRESGWSFRAGDAIDMISVMSADADDLAVVGGGYSRWLIALNAKGERIWAFYLPAPPVAWRVLENALYVGCVDGTLLKMGADGAPRARIQLAVAPAVLLSCPNNTILVGGKDGALLQVESQ